MDEIKKHLSYFPERIKGALENFPFWKDICEIRLRENLPLSLTSFEGNILIDPLGRPCNFEEALRCREEDLSWVLAAFCSGSVYRYFDTLKEGYAVDEDGWRMGLCPSKGSTGNFLPERPGGINLRIPRDVPDAARELIDKISVEGLSSFLILSGPGEGKTTLLRALASALSRGEGIGEAARVAVVDERREIFPKRFHKNTGLLDLLSGYTKKEGIEIATRLFSPQVILCDEIGNEEEAKALLSSCSGGCFVIATAHAKDLSEARKIPYLEHLLTSGRFERIASIRRISGKTYRNRILWEAVG